LSFLLGDEPDIATAAGGEEVERFLREPTLITEETPWSGGEKLQNGSQH